MKKQAASTREQSEAIMRRVARTQKSPKKDNGSKPPQEVAPDAPENPKPPSKFSEEERVAIACRAAGVHDRLLASLFISTTEQLLGRIEFPKESDRMFAASLLLGEIGPKNATESMLAIQMIGVHHAAILYLKAANSTQTAEACDLYASQSVRMMRLFLEQLEAMQRLKGKARQQRVVVEHVHIHKGGQAIVGAVTAGKGDQGEGG